MIPTVRVALTFGLGLAAPMPLVVGAQHPRVYSGMGQAYHAACPHLSAEISQLADSETTIAANLAAQIVPETEELLDLACVRMNLVANISPPASVEYLTTPHSTWDSAALHAALLARAQAPENARALRLLARIAVRRSAGRHADEGYEREWGRDATDLPLTGPPSDVFPILDDLSDWMEASTNRGETMSEGCVALALDLGRYAQAHRCAVLGIARADPPEWHLLRLAWLEVATGRDSMTATAEIGRVLKKAGHQLDPELAYLTGGKRFSMVPRSPPNWLAGLRTLTPSGWSILDWQKVDAGNVPSNGPLASEVTASGWYIRDPATGAPLLLIAARVRSDSAGTVAFSKLLQWSLTDAGVDSRVDSLVVPQDSTVVAILPGLSIGNGVGGWDLAIRQGPLKGAGAWDDRVPIVDPATLHLSDLLLGGNSADGMVMIGTDSVRVSPQSSFRADSALHLAFQIGSSTVTNSASVELYLHRTDKHADRGLRLVFPVRLAAGEQLLKYEIDLSSLKSGRYGIVATITDQHSGTTTSRNATFDIEH